MTELKDAASPARRMLIVEDEVLIGVLLEDMLIDLGYEVVATAQRLDEAVRLITDASIDGAVLDLNLNGVSAVPVADALRAKNIPFMFVTGYGERGRPDTHQTAPTLQKPFRQDDLEAKLRLLFASAPTA